MKREILFRGKRVDSGEWAYGDLRQYVNMPLGSSFFVIDTMSSEEGLGSAYDVYEDTIGQFTGLTDKNGNKIFEGDIVKVATVANAKIVWNNEDACFAFDYRKQGRPLCVDLIDDTSIEVIGNIYDNPELLESV